MMVTLRRGPRGPCGLKFRELAAVGREQSRGPRGPCGLKFEFVAPWIKKVRSRPARALWIEMSAPISPASTLQSSRPARALWIEINQINAIIVSIHRRGPRGPCGLKCCLSSGRYLLATSRPARALWIEIWILPGNLLIPCVEAREGLVD